VADPFQLNNLIGNPSYEQITLELEDILSGELNRLEDDFLPGPAYLKKFGHRVDSSGTVPYIN